MRFVDLSEAAQHCKGKVVAVVGSGPSVLRNDPGCVDGHDVVVRVNNYKVSPAAGFRTDVHYSFYGTTVKKKAEDLRRDGVKLCWNKCPNAKALESEWHRRKGRLCGIDFRYIYEQRKNWWFTDTYVPDTQSFLDKMTILQGHVPTTGFAAILDVLACKPRSVYLTGFDFFTSGLHNVDEKWRPGDPTDPIRHRPDLEAMWLAIHGRNHPLIFDAAIQRHLKVPA